MILDKPVALNVVQAFRGTVDFYTWKSINVARVWPRKPVQPNTPAQVATREAFSASHVWRKSNPVSWHQQWARMSVPSNMTTEDMRRKTALNLAYAGALVTPPDIIDVVLTYMPGPDRTDVAVSLNPAAPYDHTLVTFRSKPFLTVLPAIAYTPNILCMTRHDMPKIRHTPDVSLYREPAFLDWNAATDTHTFGIPGNHPKIAFFPYPDSLMDDANMLGPFYYTTDFT